MRNWNRCLKTKKESNTSAPRFHPDRFACVISICVCLIICNALLLWYTIFKLLYAPKITVLYVASTAIGLLASSFVVFRRRKIERWLAAGVE